MKRLIALFTVTFLVTFALHAQDKVTVSSQEKTVTKITGNTYKIEIKSSEGQLIQEGEYFKQGDNNLVPNGIWTLYAHNSTDILTRIKYDKGNQIWLETKIDGEFKRMDNDDIKIHKLESKIASLEKKINSKN